MKLLHLFNANLRREVNILKRYWPNTVSMLVTFYCIFLMMFFGIQIVGDPTTMETNVQYVIVNYIFWYLAMLAMQDIGWVVSNEATLGTLEQLYMSPMGAWKILLARIIGDTIVHLGLLVFLLLLSMWTAQTSLHLNAVSLLPVLIITLFSMYGISFMIAGLAIIIKQINAFLQILQFVFMGLTFVPLSVAPFLEFAPFVKGVDMIRKMMIDGAALSSFSVLDYVSLLANAAFYLLLGLLVFFKCEKNAMEKGILGQH
ncbi:ABC-2 type transport system permease protein [Bacillus oleivorans]|uniref:ABC-2 type transport system permease protein n=1 Tax=Bacillus oleivorans TaxID=1448271 RepID=A0A285D3Z2_9BACI|nr:ABC-2 type transport system permease protein [Bacillus oleivorans]